MTVAEAAKAWIEAKSAIDKLTPALDSAANVLKEHFRKTGRADYQGKIGYARTVQLRLDTPKVKEELGARLRDFQKPSPRETLSLLKP